MKTTPKRELPPDVIESDLEYPSSFEKRVKDLPEGLYGSLTFYFVPEGKKAPAWVLTTLHISNPSRRQSGTPARTYGIGVGDSKVYTVGRGPHVKAEVTVCLTTVNIDRLQKYVDLWVKGMSDASAIRDRISSRRAQGNLFRAEGRSHWTW